MNRLQEQALQDLARASSATGKIIEAHADKGDKVCRVVVEMGENFRNMQLREAILQLWMQDGFMASASRDGAYLMIDGVRGQENALDLINLVAHQIKEYTKSSMQRDAAREMSGSPELAFLAQAMDERDSLTT